MHCLLGILHSVQFPPGGCRACLSSCHLSVPELGWSPPVASEPPARAQRRTRPEVASLANILTLWGLRFCSLTEIFSHSYLKWMTCFDKNNFTLFIKAIYHQWDMLPKQSFCTGLEARWWKILELGWDASAGHRGLTDTNNHKWAATAKLCR